MSFITYRLKAQLRDIGEGITKAKAGEVEAVIKQDHDESPRQIYCEYVACRLADLVGVPVAAGVLVLHATGLRYASLALSEVSRALDTIDKEQLPRLLRRYPEECAALATFDLWIGNVDRLGNIKAALSTDSADRLMVGIDHGSALLNCDEIIDSAIARLEDISWPDNHPLANSGSRPLAERTLRRIESLDDAVVLEVCALDETIGSVTPMQQLDLSSALNARKQLLRQIVDRAFQSTKPGKNRM